jgi:hypothetical protein
MVTLFKICKFFTQTVGTYNLELMDGLSSLSSNTMSPRLVLQCRSLLQGLYIHNRVQLFWVPGYCGMIGNEEEDGLAGVGSKSNFCGPEPCLSALHFICVCSTLANLRTQIFGKPILSVSEYEGMSASSFVQFIEKSGRFETPF